jgi:polyhydroxyalkanoate synthase
VHPKRRHRILTWSDATTTLPADEWLKHAPLREGSWWPEWEHWLSEHSAARQVPARGVCDHAGSAKGALEDAPGSYVRG